MESIICVVWSCFRVSFCLERRLKVCFVLIQYYIMASSGALTQLRAEKENLDPSFTHAARLINEGTWWMLLDIVCCFIFQFSTKSSVACLLFLLVFVYH